MVDRLQSHRIPFSPVTLESGRRAHASNRAPTSPAPSTSSTLHPPTSSTPTSSPISISGLAPASVPATRFAPSAQLYAPSLGDGYELTRQ